MSNFTSNVTDVKASNTSETVSEPAVATVRTIASITAECRADLRPDNIPPELASLKCWLLWKADKLNEATGKFQKIPYWTNGKKRYGDQGAPLDVESLVTLDTALATFNKDKKYAGIGVACLPQFNLAIYDGDKCVSDGAIDPEREALTQWTYTEISPSRTGIRAIWRGETVNQKNNADGHELFHSKGFVTITGNRVDNLWAEILGSGSLPSLPAEKRTELEALVHTGTTPAPKAQATADHSTGDDLVLLSQTLTDEQVADLRDAMHAKLDPSDRELWVRVGQALKRCDEQGYALWAEWSAMAHNFHEYDLAKWDTFKGDRTGYASVFKMAQDRGWVNPRQTKMVAIGNTTVIAEYQATKDGAIKATANNLFKALIEGKGGARVAYDTFKCDTMICHDGARVWSELKDADYFQIRRALEAPPLNMMAINPQTLRDAVEAVALINSFDSAIEWLNDLSWDGLPRVERTLMEYFGAADTPYHRAVGRYMWTAQAGRVLEAGIKADMIPTAVGRQGMAKSQVWRKIAPNMDMACELSFAERDANTVRAMQGKLVCEIAELKGVIGRDAEATKAFITVTHDRFIPKFKEREVVRPRRNIFVATTNESDMLRDPTGNRRWLPFTATQSHPDAMERDRDQLWAEAAVLFKQGGIAWQDAQELSEVAHEEFLQTDEWEPIVLHWLLHGSMFPTADTDHGLLYRERDSAVSKGYTTVRDVLIGALSMVDRDITDRQSKRVANILRQSGWVHAAQRVRIEGVRVRVWVAPDKTVDDVIESLAKIAGRPKREI